MNTLELEETSHSPKVSCRPTGELSFAGRSIPENALDFYMPIIKWLEEYKKNPAPLTSYVFGFEYINSISFKMIYEIMKIGSHIKENGGQVTVKWMYESDDEEILDQGKTFEAKTGLKFDFVAV